MTARTLPKVMASPVLDRRMRVAGLRSGVDDDLGVNSLGQLHMSGHEVGMRMREVDTGDLEAQLLSVLQVAVDVAGRVHDQGLAAAADQVGVMREHGQIVLSEDNVVRLLGSLLDQLHLGRGVAVRRCFGITGQRRGWQRTDG
jgi:hypothetical protein